METRPRYQLNTTLIANLDDENTKYFEGARAHNINHITNSMQQSFLVLKLMVLN
jgi:hypothetical protein